MAGVASHHADHLVEYTKDQINHICTLVIVGHTFKIQCVLTLQWQKVLLGSVNKEAQNCMIDVDLQETGFDPNGDVEIEIEKYAHMQVSSNNQSVINIHSHTGWEKIGTFSCCWADSDLSLTDVRGINQQEPYPHDEYLQALMGLGAVSDQRYEVVTMVKKACEGYEKQDSKGYL
ncbi:hypothetical protein SERLA73DRAFT_151051 [Serpula lacrymans var. lacrymans S7.3]|uniref:Uncharacterized protein n=1 Tax=Serpula lacrymans var. lacrymans (strain S7.3) TaxID=936435 RepID=F8PPG6_SERL3|nr:hypothetical protein SERLA73DRAFT_151051 [Serpula lacrymans var. lacrymans S7.3]